jgi:hypothetical protein
VTLDITIPISIWVLAIVMFLEVEIHSILKTIIGLVVARNVTK